MSDKFSGAGYAALGIGTLGSIAGSIAETDAYKSKLDAMVEARVANMNMAVTNFELEQYMMKQQINDLDQVLRDKLSARSLEALKDEARLKAASAETGTTGGTTATAVNEAWVNEHFDRANIIANERNKQKSIMNSMSLSSQKLSSELSGLASGIPKNNTNPLLAGLATGLGGLSTSLSMMTSKDKALAFGIPTT